MMITCKFTVWVLFIYTILAFFMFDSTLVHARRKGRRTSKAYLRKVQLDAFGRGHFWPSAHIPYVLQTQGFDAAELEQVWAAIRLIEKNSCIKFVPRVKQKEYILIRRTRTGFCSSIYGYEKGSVTDIEYGKDRCFTMGSLIHEMMHALGFGHEHSRADRDKHIQVVWSIIPKDELHRYQFEKFSSSKYPVKGPYDYYSVLHYALWMRRAKRVPESQTLVPKIPPGSGEHVDEDLVGQRYAPTPTDFWKIRAAYNCPGSFVSKKEVPSHSRSAITTEPPPNVFAWPRSLEGMAAKQDRLADLRARTELDAAAESSLKTIDSLLGSLKLTSNKNWRKLQSGSKGAGIVVV